MFGPLMLDLFADDSNAKCPVWYTAEDNALTQDWSEMLSSIGGAAFGNPLTAALSTTKSKPSLA
jgi:phage N-6-adenine-methyltransferase